MSNRKVLAIIGGFLGICLLLCVVLGVVTIRSLRINLGDTIEQGIAAVIDTRLTINGTPSPGSYVITQEEILDQINSALLNSDANIKDLVVDIHPGNQIEIGFKSQDEHLTYLGTIAVADGRLDVPEVTFQGSGSMSTLIKWAIPGSRIGDAIEEGVNSFLVANHLRLTGFSTEAGKMTLTVAAD